MEGLNLIVSGGGFCAVYYKSTDQPQLMLRLRTKTDDYKLLARAWMTANRIQLGLCQDDDNKTACSLITGEIVI